MTDLEKIKVLEDNGVCFYETNFCGNWVARLNDNVIAYWEGIDDVIQWAYDITKNNQLLELLDK